MSIEIRPLCDKDGAHIARIFFLAVHEGTQDAYNADERRAWAGDVIDLPTWKERARTLNGFIATEANAPVGFMTIDASGHIDLAFVLPAMTRKCVGSALLSAAEDWAVAHGARQLTAAASLVARPFFESHGWTVHDAKDVTRNGVTLRRFRMEKSLQGNDA
ncbi:GNAT family N-acetyltransferase [Oceanibium sediminis]|uniref:GNAT family N-acetyltransferase n=1 Tax=Oceanibium sediminis TaxID=2026339 RepID=UPI000DD306EA|nr:GNAT family N-acetyltransferase [Oceanibium sediminis]